MAASGRHISWHHWQHQQYLWEFFPSGFFYWKTMTTAWVRKNQDYPSSSELWAVLGWETSKAPGVRVAMTHNACFWTIYLTLANMVASSCHFFLMFGYMSTVNESYLERCIFKMTKILIIYLLLLSELCWKTRKAPGVRVAMTHNASFCIIYVKPHSFYNKKHFSHCFKERWILSLEVSQPQDAIFLSAKIKMGW